MFPITILTAFHGEDTPNGLLAVTVTAENLQFLQTLQALVTANDLFRVHASYTKGPETELVGTESDNEQIQALLDQAQSEPVVVPAGLVAELPAYVPEPFESRVDVLTLVVDDEGFNYRLTYHHGDGYFDNGIIEVAALLAE